MRASEGIPAKKITKGSQTDRGRPERYKREPRKGKGEKKKTERAFVQTEGKNNPTSFTSEALTQSVGASKCRVVKELSSRN